MARYVNPQICASEYGVTLNCTIDYADPENKTFTSLGGMFPGDFEGDPDIAGIGVLGAFVAVTIISVVLAIINTIWWIAKNVFHWKSRLTHEEKAEKKWQLSISGFCETLVLTCSDQQIFTGGAYAITLRYARACSISAYHYNIVTNMLLFTCATHLMAVTIAKHYWHHPWIAGLRIAITALVYFVTGLILSNQNSSGVNFPTRVPSPEEKYSTMLLAAACFQSGQDGLANDIQNAFTAKDVGTFFTKQIPGFTQYLVMCMFYIIAVMVSVGRFIRRGADHDGRRKRFLEWFKRNFSLLFRARRFFYFLFAIYLVAGVGIACWTVQGSFRYIYDLRFWVRNSIWQSRNGNDRASEDDPATFGQLVPILLMSLTVFSFLHLLAEQLSVKKRRAQMMEEMEKQQHQHSGSSDGRDGKLTQANTANGYFDLPTIQDKSSGIGFAVTEFGNLTPGTTASTGPTPGIHGQGMQPPQPPHLQSRSQTWASNMTTGTSATQGSNRSVSYSRPHNGSQTFVGQPQQQQQQQTQQPARQHTQNQQAQQQQQSDIIAPVTSGTPVQILQSSNQSQTQFQPVFTTSTGTGEGTGGYTIFYAAAPSSTVDLMNTVPMTSATQPQTQSQQQPTTWAAPTQTQPQQQQQSTTWAAPAGYYTVPTPMTTSGSNAGSNSPTPPPHNMNTSTYRGPSPPRRQG